MKSTPKDRDALRLRLIELSARIIRLRSGGTLDQRRQLAELEDERRSMVARYNRLAEVL